MRVSFKKVMTHENLSVILTRHMHAAGKEISTF